MIKTIFYYTTIVFRGKLTKKPGFGIGGIPAHPSRGRATAIVILTGTNRGNLFVINIIEYFM
ncbi:MAG: hypothetical protein R6V54_04700, partial [Desulfobacteraceae bacterium]